MYTANISRLLLFICCSLFLTACDELKLVQEETQQASKEDNPAFYLLENDTLALTQEKNIYIPVYSEVYVAGGGKLNLAITLSIRNTDFNYPLIVNKVDYYNSRGKLIEHYLQVPYLLEPMASTYFFVSQTDARGGSGANFVVKWSADKQVNEPVLEAVMAGSTGTQGMAFTSTGREMKTGELIVVNEKANSFDVNN